MDVQTLILGVFFGLGAALCQAFSYIFSRRFLKECNAKSQLLFGMSHLIMGVVALAALPFLLHSSLPPWHEWLKYLGGTAGAYLAAQLFLFAALNRADSSKVAPLLGVKIPTLGIMSLILFAETPSPLGWVAMLVCVAAGLLISPPSGIPQATVLGMVAMACLGYCISDLCIPRLVDALAGASESPILLGVSLTYSLCGAVGLAIVLQQGILTDTRILRYAFPHALSWLAGISFLFACFDTIGVISGNMLQSTRGVLSVLLGVGITRLGWLHIDNISGKRVFIRRFCGAMLMTAAIITYLHVEKRPGTAETDSREGTRTSVTAKRRLAQELIGRRRQRRENMGLVISHGRNTLQKTESAPNS